MNVEELKSELKNIFGNDIIFNKDFDYHATLVKNIDSNLLEWCKNISEDKIKPIFPEKLKDGIVFIKKIGGSTRCIIIKVINGKVREIHLGDHKYYDKLTKAIGLKKSSETY